MKRYADREYLHTRIHSMKGRLMGLKEYASFSRDWETVRDEEGKVDERKLAAGKERLFEEQTRDVVILAEASEYHKPLFMAFLRYFEVQNMGAVMAAAAGMETTGQWYPIGRYTLVERSLLYAPPSLPLLRKLLRGTYLETVLETASSYTRLQAGMEQCIFSQALNAAGALDRQDSLLFLEMIAMRVALEATLRRRRLVLNYRLSDRKIDGALAFTGQVPIPGTARRQAAMESLYEQERDRIKKERGVEPSLDDIEYSLELYYHQWVSRFFYRDFHTVCSVAAYLWLLMRQLRNLFGVIDGLRFGLSREAIMGRLVTEV